MTRPTLKEVSQGLQSWDADVNDNFTALWSGPLPLVQDTPTYPSASSYDDCLLIDSSDHHIRVSDGSNWYIVPKQAAAIEDIEDNSGGNVPTPASISSVTDQEAADAIAVLAAKVNEILYELRQGKTITT